MVRTILSVWINHNHKISTYFYRAIEDKYFNIKTYLNGGRLLTALSSGEVQLCDANGKENQMWFWKDDLLKNKSLPSKVHL